MRHGSRYQTGTSTDPLLHRKEPVARSTSSTTPAQANLDRLYAQATDQLRRQARATHDLADRFREQYRRRLESWVALRNRLENRNGNGNGKPAHDTHAAGRRRRSAVEALRADHDALGRELSVQQAQLKRLQAAAHHQELLLAYLGTTNPQAGEPSLADSEETPATMRLRVIDAQEGERQRLAEEVHDGPAQVLTNAIFQLEYLDRVIDDSPRAAHAELAFLRRMLRDGLDEVRGFIAELRPPAVDMGLAQALADRANEFGERHGMDVAVDVAGIDAGLSPEAKSSVLRIVQEALQNVRKHAAATEVRIALEGDTLTIADNGRGFDVMRLASGITRSFGLQFMRERAELMAASVQIESRQGEGTRILIRLPERSR
jgi:two-component system sensor histidine kinase DegS